MRYAVKESCSGCGFCAYCCPEVFSMKEDGHAEAENKETTSRESAAAGFALAHCPNNAIVRTE